MRTTRNYRLPFDAALDFVASRDLRCSGVLVAAKASFDKTLVTPRRLQQLYEQRLIQYVDGQVPAKPPPKPLAIGPTDFRNPSKTGTSVVRRILRKVTRTKRMRPTKDTKDTAALPASSITAD